MWQQATPVTRPLPLVRTASNRSVCARLARDTAKRCSRRTRAEHAALTAACASGRRPPGGCWCCLRFRRSGALALCPRGARRGLWRKKSGSAASTADSRACLLRVRRRRLRAGLAVELRGARCQLWRVVACSHQRAACSGGPWQRFSHCMNMMLPARAGSSSLVAAGANDTQHPCRGCRAGFRLHVCA
jgi:hypothetical protein